MRSTECVSPVIRQVRQETGFPQEGKTSGGRYADVLTRQMQDRLAALGATSLTDAQAVIGSSGGGQETLFRSLIACAGRLAAHLEGRPIVDWQRIRFETRMDLGFEAAVEHVLPDGVAVVRRLHQDDPVAHFMQLYAVDFAKQKIIDTLPPVAFIYSYGVWLDSVIVRYEHGPLGIWNPREGTNSQLAIQPTEDEYVFAVGQYVYYLLEKEESSERPTLRRISLATGQETITTIPKKYQRAKIVAVTDEGYFVLSTLNCPRVKENFVIYNPQTRRRVDGLGDQTSHIMDFGMLTGDNKLLYRESDNHVAAFGLFVSGQKEVTFLFSGSPYDEAAPSPFDPDHVVVLAHKKTGGPELSIFERSETVEGEDFVCTCFPAQDGTAGKTEHGFVITPEGKIVVSWGDELLVYGDGREA